METILLTYHFFFLKFATLKVYIVCEELGSGGIQNLNKKKKCVLGIQNTMGAKGVKKNRGTGTGTGKLGNRKPGFRFEKTKNFFIGLPGTGLNIYIVLALHFINIYIVLYIFF
jgi:hypothetical protein